MAGWHHWLDGRESVWTLGVVDGQGGLVCCDSWGHKKSDTTEWLNWTEWSSGFPYLLQFKSEFGNKELMIWAPFSSQSCFLLTVYSFSIFGCKDYNQSDFGVDYLVMSMCRVFSCVVCVFVYLVCPTNPSSRKSVLNSLWKDWCWSWNSNTLATWCEELIHLKWPWCWERLKAGGEGDNRG